MNPSAEQIAHKLARPGTEPTGSGGNWQTNCPLPGHVDNRPSLSVTDTNGKILMHCHAGCDQAEVFKAGSEICGISRPKPRQSSSNQLGPVVATYKYRAEDGQTLFEKSRHEPKAFRVRRPDGKGGYVNNLKDVDDSLIYNYPEVVKAIKAEETVWLCEGEKDCNALMAWGLVATCNVWGASQDGRKPKWKDANSSWMIGAKQCFIIPDNDAPGRAHANAIARANDEFDIKSKIITLPGVPEKGDVSDFLASGGTKEQLIELAAQAEYWSASQQQPIQQESSKHKPPKDNAESAEIVALAKEDAHLFSDLDDIAYASFLNGAHNETWPILGSHYKKQLRHLFFAKFKKPPQSQALADAIATLEAEALFSGDKKETAVRVGRGPNGSVILDLCNDNWEVAIITPDGWTITSKSPIPMIRFSGMRNLPDPSRNGNVKKLKTFINAPSDELWTLMLAFLLSTLMLPDGSYPVLVLQGGQGCGKSITSEMLRKVVDPSKANLRSLSREESDFTIAASNSWIQTYNNLSGLNNEQSDWLCSLSSGGGLSRRKLYTDSEEVIINIKRPCILNGIDDIATRPDLLDRALVCTLPVIEKMTKEQKLRADFEKALPDILGGLLDVVSGILKSLPNTSIDHLPRMTDFALWVSAAENVLGWDTGHFMQMYAQNQQGAIEAGLESDRFATVIRLCISKENAWEGTTTEFLKLLADKYAEPEDLKLKQWPNTKTLKNQLMRLQAPLSKVGIIYAGPQARTNSERSSHKFTYRPRTE